MKRYKGKKKLVDNLFAEIIKSVGYCEAQNFATNKIKCSSILNNAHICSRRRNSTFADTRNALALCVSHHMYFHDFPREFSHFLTTIWAQEYYDQVFAKSWIPVKANDRFWQERLDFLGRIQAGEVSLEQARKLEE